MKIPLESQFTIIPASLTESIKEELLRSTAPRYTWIALPDPIRLIGHDFAFAVLPLKLTPELALKQTGRGVACQTEAEAKETVELLSQAAKQHIVAFQTAGFGSVGTITHFRHIITEHSARCHNGKQGQNPQAITLQLRS